MFHLILFLFFGAICVAGLIKRHLERGIVRLQQHVGNYGFICQLRMLTLMARVLMAAAVPPWPAIETAFVNMRDVIGDKVVTQAIAFVHRARQLSRRGIYCQTAARAEE